MRGGELDRFTRLDDQVLVSRVGLAPAHREVEVVEGEQTALEVRDDVLVGVRLADGRQVALEALAVAPRFVVRSDLLATLGVRTVDHLSGFGVPVPADPIGRTDVAGVWVAGNITDPGTQVITARGPGQPGRCRHQRRLRGRGRGSVAEGSQMHDCDVHDAREWDERYTGNGGAAMWSGRPNGAVVAEVVSLLPGTALDVGCGEGADAIWLARQGWTVTGVDPSGVALDRARTAAKEAGVEVTWVCSGLLGMPDATGVHDLVSAQYAVLRRDDNNEAITALIGAVAPGGTLLVVHHDLERAHTAEHGFDPAEHVMPGDVAAHLDERWEVEVHDTRPRLGHAPSDARHIRDIILRAHRLTPDDGPTPVLLTSRTTRGGPKEVDTSSMTLPQQREPRETAHVDDRRAGLDHSAHSAVSTHEP